MRLAAKTGTVIALATMVAGCATHTPASQSHRPPFEADICFKSPNAWTIRTHGVREYLERVGKALTMNYKASRRQLSATADMALVVRLSSDGVIENIEVEQTSGDPNLDAAVSSWISMGAPFGRLPEDATAAVVTVRIQFAKGQPPG